VKVEQIVIRQPKTETEMSVNALYSVLTPVKINPKHKNASWIIQNSEKVSEFCVHLSTKEFPVLVKKGKSQDCGNGQPIECLATVFQ
jgi:hypothetical protein